MLKRSADAKKIAACEGPGVGDDGYRVLDSCPAMIGVDRSNNSIELHLGLIKGIGIGRLVRFTHHRNQWHLLVDAILLTFSGSIITDTSFEGPRSRTHCWSCWIRMADIGLS